MTFKEFRKEFLKAEIIAKFITVFYKDKINYRIIKKLSKIFNIDFWQLCESIDYRGTKILF